MTETSTSRGALGWLGAVLAGCVSAAAFVLALAHAESGAIFLAYLAALPIFMSGLGSGIISGAIATVIAIAGVLLGHSAQAAGIYVVINALPALVLVVLAMRFRRDEQQKVHWYPNGNLLVALTLYPCIVFLMANLAFIGQDGGLLGFTQRSIGDAVNQLTAELEGDTAANFKDTMQQLGKIMPALVGVSWMMLMLGSGLVAQYTLKKQNWLLRDTFKLSNIEVPNWLIITTAVTGVVGMFAPAPFDYMGTNLAVILCVPFCFVGLSVVYAYLDGNKHRSWLLIIFYILLSLLPWLILLVGILGALEHSLHFRLRFAIRQSPR